MPEASGQDDGELIARVREGDPGAFEALVRRHIQAALDVAGSILRGAEDAEDACQEAFILALRRIDQCRNPDSFRAWLLMIVRNRALGILNARTRRNELAMAHEDLHPPTPPDPLVDAWRSEIRRDVREAMRTLTRLQRSVLVLHDVEGWNHPEIGQRLGISAGSSRVHLHVARRTMRKRLGPRYAETLT
jgi:RNA polymerase sigma-70 factor (ECF subfamily)